MANLGIDGEQLSALILVLVSEDDLDLVPARGHHRRKVRGRDVHHPTTRLLV